MRENQLNVQLVEKAGLISVTSDCTHFVTILTTLQQQPAQIDDLSDEEVSLPGAGPPHGDEEVCVC